MLQDNDSSIIWAFIVGMIMMFVIMGLKIEKMLVKAETQGIRRNGKLYKLKEIKLY